MNDMIENETVIPTTANADSPTGGQPDQPKIQTGYTVGLLDNGQFVFQLHGEKSGLVELLGIHGYASSQVQKIQDDTLILGDKLTLEVGEGLQLLMNELQEVKKLLSGDKTGNWVPKGEEL